MYYWTNIQILYKYLIRTRLDLSNRYGVGSYALVTGAANGIGLEFAKQLVMQGFGVVMLDIDQSGLEEAKQTIVNLNGNAKVEIFQ